MNLLVVDASVVLAAYLPAEPYKSQSLAILAPQAAFELVAPTLISYELLNAVSRTIRGLKPIQGVSSTDVSGILDAIRGLGIVEMSVTGLESRILEIAVKYERTGYDAAYVALAEHLDAEFVTGDLRLRNALAPDFPFVRFIGDFSAP